MQGAFAEHIRALEVCGAKTRLVRSPGDLDGLDGIVLPGGESTTMTMLMDRMGLLEPLHRAISEGLATLATCAGMIVLAREVSDGMTDQRGMGLLDIGVRRNGYGRQVESFEAALQVSGLGDKTFPGIFIRAPLVESTGQAEVIATHEGRPVAVRQGRIVALCFHPELTGDLRLHRQFVRMAINKSDPARPRPPAINRSEPARPRPPINQSEHARPRPPINRADPARPLPPS